MIINTDIWNKEVLNLVRGYCTCGEWKQPTTYEILINKNLSFICDSCGKDWTPMREL